MKHVAIIPARSGSKRLKNKNVINFKGKPIIEHTIDHALESQVFEKIIVSTDFESLREVCKKKNIIYSKRPKSLCTSNATVVEVCLHELQKLKKFNISFDVLTCLYATSPLRNSNHIREIVKMISPPKVNFAIAITNYDLPLQRQLKMNENGYIRPIWKDKIKQNYSNFYINNGSTFSAFIPAFEKEKTFQGNKTKGYYMDKKFSIDIDTKFDFDFLKFVSKQD